MPADQLTAGAPAVYPARTPGGGPLLHLARTEARKRREPALIGVCPAVVGMELERAEDPRRRWWQLWRRRPAWCTECRSYRDYLAKHGRL